MIRIAMCDDETMFLQTYQKKVSELFQEHNVDCKIDTYTDARRFLEDCEKTSYDLIFLDIDMPGLSGIQLASKFRDKGLDTTLVFVSSHDDFVFETFRYNAYRFVRKNKLISDTQEMISSFCAALKTKSVIVRLDSDQQRTLESYLVNYTWILQIKGDWVYLKANHDKIPLSRGRSEEVKLQYQRLMREEGVL